MAKLALKLLHALDPETAHDLLTCAARAITAVPCAIDLTSWWYGRRIPRMAASVTYRGVTLPNSVGMAAGFDKQGCLALFLQALGFGFVEVGTVLPRAQAGNLRPRVFRYKRKRMVVNRMGFNSIGAHAVAKNLERIHVRLRIPIGISLGKMKDTPLERAADDYVAALDPLFKYASYVVINVSSPNTPGLRELQRSAYLEALVRQVRNRMVELAGGGFVPPLFVKIDPDATDEETLMTVGAALQGGADGVIVANTSLSFKICEGQEQGGASGQGIFPQTTHKVRLIREKFPDVFIIGVGGIENRGDATVLRLCGVNAIQLYTGFIFKGPPLVAECVHAMSEPLEMPNIAPKTRP